MAKNIVVKLIKAGIRSRLFNILDQYDNTIASSIERQDLINGMSFSVDDSVTSIKVVTDNGVSKLKVIGSLH